MSSPRTELPAIMVVSGQGFSELGYIYAQTIGLGVVVVLAWVLAKIREVDVSAAQKALRMCRVLFTGLP